MNLLNQRSAALLALLLATSAAPAVAAEHFAHCASNTGSNATLVLPETAIVEVLGQPLSEGDEIAIYTAEGVCAGAGVWTGSTLAFAVWGDDMITPDADGLLVGEALQFRVWITSTSEEVSGTAVVDWSTARSHYAGHGNYVENGLFVVDRLTMTRSTSEEEVGKAVSTEAFLPGDVPVTLNQNFPNPFNPSTTISYSLSASTNVRLTVLNVLGQTVRTLTDTYQAAGDYQVRLNMDALPSGMYLYRVETPEMTLTRTMLLSK